jgi:CRISPR/Cas system-associated exonuclease Cas4 (RecB family)
MGMSSKSGVFLELLKTYLEGKSKNNDRRYEYFHPSEFAECVRKIAYKHRYEEGDDKISGDLQRIFDNGHGMHARYADFLTGMGIAYGIWKCKNPLCYKEYGRDDLLGIPERKEKCDDCGCEEYSYEEVNVHNEEYKFSGHVDGIFELSKEFFVVDYKSMFSFQFKKLAEPLQKHVIQLSIYIWLLDLDAGFLLYECKDDQKIKMFEVARNEQLIQSIKDRASRLIEIMDEGKLPKRPYASKTDKHCKRCPFRKTCWKK